MQNNKQYSSFTANIQTVLKNQTNQLSLLSSMQQALVSDSKYVSYTYLDADGYEHTYTLPSYGMILNELEAVKQSINNLLTGQGTIRLGDKVCTLKVNQIATVPDDILMTEDPTNFSLDTNWFFESLMFPGAVVTINLAGQVDNKTQQVEICRVILDATNTDAEALWESRLKNESLNYTDLIQLLNNNNIEYSEDIQTYTMPWIHNRYVGSFTVLSDPLKINGEIWYFLNTINYSTISESGINQGANNILSINDKLTYNDSVFVITNIDLNKKAITIKCISGAAYPGQMATFNYYRDPTFDKKVKVRFGADEYNFIFVKAISHDFGIKSNLWSPSIKFESNTLLYNDDNTITFKEFYDSHIVDWGKSMLAEAKNKYIQLTESVEVLPPVLNPTDFKIVLINSHKNSDKDLYTIKKSISDLNALRNTITTYTQKYNSIANDIIQYGYTSSNDSTNNSTNNSAANVDVSTYYHSALASLRDTTSLLTTARKNYNTTLATIQKEYAKSESLQTYTPKYRIRGYFQWPNTVYIDNDKTKELQVIQFEIAYRYKTKNNEIPNTAQYTATNSDGVLETKTIDDWITYTTDRRDRIYNDTTLQWTWAPLSDKDVSQIPHVDIAISQNECVEFKVRSISEAGYPASCRKSEWSNSVTIQFDDTLIDADTYSTYIDMIRTETNKVAVIEELNNSGINTHLSDSVLDYAHQSLYIAYIESNGVVKKLSDKIASLESKIKSLEKDYNSMIATPFFDSSTNFAGSDELVDINGSSYRKRDIYAIMTAMEAAKKTDNNSPLPSKPVVTS